ncbi:hypothetical protein AB837_00635 [bacterium AB1]|nr:hypothetical protein AB837_00635 [bacterium AB1]
MLVGINSNSGYNNYNLPSTSTMKKTSGLVEAMSKHLDAKQKTNTNTNTYNLSLYKQLTSPTITKKLVKKNQLLAKLFPSKNKKN